MRVALDGQPLLAPLAGVGHYTVELVHALAGVDERHRYSVLVPRPVRFMLGGRGPLPRFSEANVETIVPGWPAAVRARIRRRLGYEADMGRGRPPFDVFHATNNVFPFRVRATRSVLTIHDLTLLLFPEWHPADRLAAMVPGLEPAVKRADHVITPSAATRRDVLKLLPVEPEHVSVVPEGIATVFRPQSPAEVEAGVRPLGLKAGEYLLFVGTLEPRKNLERLLRAMELVGSEVGPLVLAGGHGWNNTLIRRAAERLARAGRVRVLGYVASELRAPLLAGARAFVYPSLYEGFGLPPLEAMACGTPVVTSSAASLPEVVGDAALLTNPEDVDALVTSLERIWHDAPLRADLRARGLVRAREFTWDRTARLTLDVYRMVLGA